MNNKKRDISQEDFIAKMRSLSGIDTKKSLNESVNTKTSTLHYTKKGADGIVYAIIQENKDYFIKKSAISSEAKNAADFVYIGGEQNILSEKYTKYSEAKHRLNLKLKSLNEAYGSFIVNEISALNIPKHNELSDSGDDQSMEAQNTPPANPAPEPVQNNQGAEQGQEAPQTVDNTPPAPAPTPEPEAQSGEQGTEEPQGDTENGEEDPSKTEGITEKEIQKLIGKLSYELSNIKTDSDDIYKNALNTIATISLKKMDVDAKDELIKKIEDSKDDDNSEGESQEGEVASDGAEGNNSGGPEMDEDMIRELMDIMGEDDDDQSSDTDSGLDESDELYELKKIQTELDEALGIMDTAKKKVASMHKNPVTTAGADLKVDKEYQPIKESVIDNILKTLIKEAVETHNQEKTIDDNSLKLLRRYAGNLNDQDFEELKKELGSDKINKIISDMQRMKAGEKVESLHEDTKAFLKRFKK